MRDPHGLAALATIVTSTPGHHMGRIFRRMARRSRCTCSTCDDEQAWIDTIKQRYERLLMEIFE